MIFASDLDDTLFREIDYVHSAYRAIGRELESDGIMTAKEAVDALEMAETTARGFDNLAALIWQNYPGSRYDVKWMLNIYRTHKPDIHLLPGARKLLDTLRNEGVEIALITDGRSNTQRAKIEALGLMEYVKSDNIIISEEVGGDKTTEIPFTTLMARNPSQSSFLYLGDNPAKDFRWPNALGWTTVELFSPGWVHVNPQDVAVPEEYRAQYVVTSLPEAASFAMPG